MEKKRIVWMDIAKALGMLVVLLVHSGREFGWVTFFGGMFYMPVFFVLAGMTFSYRPEEDFLVFLKKKERRLLVPYFAYNAFLFVIYFLREVLAGGQIGRETFFPLVGIMYSRYCFLPASAGRNLYFLQILNSPTWFLTGLFVCLLFFWVMMQASGGDRRKLLILNCVVLVLAISAHYFVPILLPWSIDTALYAVSFLTFGRLAADYELVELAYKKPWLSVLLAAAFAGLSVLNGTVNMSVANYGRSMVLYLAVGCLGSWLCMVAAMFLERHTRVLSRIGEWVGRHTIPILCLHLLGYSVIGAVMAFVRGLVG